MESTKQLVDKTTIGIEIEANTDIAMYTECVLLEAGLNFQQGHAESRRIQEVNPAPVFLSNFYNVLYYGELVKAAQPFYWRGGSDPTAGSTHCHVAMPGTPEDLHEKYWQDGAASYVIPFATLGYMKNVKKVFREQPGYNMLSFGFENWKNGDYADEDSYLGHINNRGCGCKLNCIKDTSTLEFRINENSPLWVYIMLFVGEQTDAPMPQLYKKLGDLGNSHNHVINEDILSEIRPYLQDNIEKMSLMVKARYRKDFIAIMSAYISEDKEEFDKIVTPMLQKSQNNWAKVTRKVADFVARRTSEHASLQYSDPYPSGFWKDIKNLGKVKLIENYDEVTTTLPVELEKVLPYLRNSMFDIRVSIKYTPLAECVREFMSLRDKQHWSARDIVEKIGVSKNLVDRYNKTGKILNTDFELFNYIAEVREKYC